jgi:hypothetical protein
MQFRKVDEIEMAVTEEVRNTTEAVNNTTVKDATRVTYSELALCSRKDVVIVTVVTKLCRARKKMDIVLNENIDIKASDADFLHVIQADGHNDDIEVIVDGHGNSVAAIGK